MACPPSAAGAVERCASEPVCLRGVARDAAAPTAPRSANRDPGKKLPVSGECSPLYPSSFQPAPVSPSESADQSAPSSNLCSCLNSSCEPHFFSRREYSHSLGGQFVNSARESRIGRISFRQLSLHKSLFFQPPHQNVNASSLY